MVCDSQGYWGSPIPCLMCIFAKTSSHNPNCLLANSLSVNSSSAWAMYLLRNSLTASSRAGKPIRRTGETFADGGEDQPAPAHRSLFPFMVESTAANFNQSQPRNFSRILAVKARSSIVPLAAPPPIPSETVPKRLDHQVEVFSGDVRELFTWRNSAATVPLFVVSGADARRSLRLDQGRRENGGIDQPDRRTASSRSMFHHDPQCPAGGVELVGIGV